MKKKRNSNSGEMAEAMNDPFRAEAEAEFFRCNFGPYNANSVSIRADQLRDIFESGRVHAVFSSPTLKFF